MSQTKNSLSEALSLGALDETLSSLYGPGSLGAAKARCEGLLAGYRTAFGGEPAGLFSAPGRTELGGNHTDHQRGRVLCASVDLDVLAAAAPNGEQVIRVLSEGFPADEISLDDLATPRPEEVNRSAALIRGVASRIRELGFEIGGFNACLTSAVPGGSGLSSSAAYEVLIAGILNELFCSGKLTPVELAQAGQYAENRYFGKPSGLMDQCGSAVGGVVAIDFANPDFPVVERIPFDLRATGYALCILDSGADHADLTGEYAAVAGEMGSVASFFRQKVLSQVDEREFLDRLPTIRAAVGDRAILRALHFFADSRRAAAEADALRHGDFQWFLKLVNESGRSSALYLQNITPPGQTVRQALSLTLALCEKYLDGRGACRVHGGGFGGTAQAFVPLDLVPSFRMKLESVLGVGSCHVLSLRPVGFTRLV